jgi:hypothetical protein
MCEYYPKHKKNNRFQSQPHRWSLDELGATFIEKLQNARSVATMKVCALCMKTEKEVKLRCCIGCKHGNRAPSYYCVSRPVPRQDLLILDVISESRMPKRSVASAQTNMRGTTPIPNLKVPPLQVLSKICKRYGSTP